MKKPLSDHLIIEGLLLKQERLTDQIVKHLYQSNKGSVRNLVLRCGGSSDDADDLFQEVILIFLENVWEQKFTLQDAGVKTYIYGIAKRVLFKKFQKDSTREKYEVWYQEQLQDRGLDVQGEESIDSVDIATLNDLFQSLTQPIQQVLEAFYRDGLTMQQIADKYELPSEASAKMRKSRGFKEWKELLIKYKFI